MADDEGTETPPPAAKPAKRVAKATAPEPDPVETDTDDDETPMWDRLEDLVRGVVADELDKKLPKAATRGAPSGASRSGAEPKLGFLKQLFALETPAKKD